MIAAVQIALLVATLAFVAWPFFARPRRGVLPAEGGEKAAAAERWQRQKSEAYGAIKDAEFDYRMGKLSEDDYHALRQTYAAKALEAIAALEAAEPQARPAPATAQRARIAFCPQCGRRVDSGANFCAQCGRSLAELASAVA